jgi:hypothetical protein
MCLNLTLDLHSNFQSMMRMKHEIPALLAASDYEDDEFADMPPLEPAPEFTLPPASASSYLSRVYPVEEEILIPYTWHSTNPNSVIVPSDPVDKSDDEDEDFDLLILRLPIKTSLSLQVSSTTVSPRYTHSHYHA